MISTQHAPTLRAYLQNTALSVLTLLVVNFFVTWLLGWRDLHGYGHGLFFAGASVLAVGLFSYFGLAHYSHGINFHYSQGVAPGPDFRPAVRAIGETSAGFFNMSVLCIAGLLTVLLGALLEYAFPPLLGVLP